MTHAEKEQVLIEIQQEKKYDVFFETGTYKGLMIEAMEGYFDEMISIEADAQIYFDTCNRLNIPSCKLIKDDSANLGKYINDTKSYLFYLDAHGKFGEQIQLNPLLAEIESIQQGELSKYTIVIDDVNLFGVHDFPTMDELTAMLIYGGYAMYENLLIHDYKRP